MQRMELSQAMRTTGTCRDDEDREAPDIVLHRAFEVARFGPRGSDRQSVRQIVLRDPAVTRARANLCLPLWRGSLDGIDSFDVQVGASPRSVTGELAVSDADLDHPCAAGHAQRDQQLVLAGRPVGVEAFADAYAELAGGCPAPPCP